MRRAPLIVAAVAFAVSANTLAGGFVWDDLVQIVANPWIVEPRRLAEAFATHAVGYDATLRTSYYRPLVHVTYAGVHAVFGLEPWAYHLLNVLLHAMASVCVYVLASRFAKGASALVAALLFAVHPIHSEAVAWASGIYDVAFSLLILLALLALTDERRRVQLLAPGAFAIALLWKEPAMAFVPVAAAYLGARREARYRDLVALGAVAVAYLALRVSALGGLTGGDRNPLEVTATEGALTSIAVLAEYGRMLVLPVGLSAIHDFPVVTSPADPRFLAGCAVVIALGIAAWRARRSPAAVLGLALLVFPVLPALYIPALKDSLLAERYLYLPSAGAAVLLALGLDRASWARAAASIAILACAAGMVVRNGVWRDSTSLWTDATTKAPMSAVAWENLGGSLAVDRRYAEAITPLTRAIGLDPARTDARTNLALCLGAVGRREEAVHHALAAAAQCPQCGEPREVLRWLTAR